MRTSVYTSLFNYDPEKFDLFGAFKNWSKYSDEIVIATFEDQREGLEGVVAKVFLDYNGKDDFYNRFKIVSCLDTSLDDPLFDGKLKNAALQACSNELVIQQDMDERIGGDTEQWDTLKYVLKNRKAPHAAMIQVIDLYKDFDHYKGVGAKWYLHLKEKSNRGPVNFARRGDGSIDTNKSDSCELIDENGDLIPYFIDPRFAQLFTNKEIESFDISMPHVIHLGYVDLNKRIENNKFWQPIWSNRNGEEVKTAVSLEQLEKENKYFKHKQKSPWWV
jgi:hypothetical protein